MKENNGRGPSDRLPMKEYKAILFDLDGVIFDTEQAYIKCWEALQDTYEMPDIREVLLRTLGVTSERTREIFLEAYGPSFPYDEILPDVGKVWKEQMPDGLMPVKPGARELLGALREAGIPLAIASSTNTALVERELSDLGLRSYFDIVAGGDQVTRSKPAPDIFLTAMEQLSKALSLPLSPADCVVIEDSFHGIRAADVAGMRPIMVPDLLQPTEEIRRLAETVLPDLDAAGEYLLARWGGGFAE